MQSLVFAGAIILACFAVLALLAERRSRR